MKNGEIYRGHLNDAEDTMNCFMTGGETRDTEEALDNLGSRSVPLVYELVLFLVSLGVSVYQ